MESALAERDVRVAGQVGPALAIRLDVVAERGQQRLGDRAPSPRSHHFAVGERLWEARRGTAWPGWGQMYDVWSGAGGSGYGCKAAVAASLGTRPCGGKTKLSTQLAAVQMFFKKGSSVPVTGYSL